MFSIFHQVSLYSIWKEGMIAFDIVGKYCALLDLYLYALFVFFYWLSIAFSSRVFVLFLLVNAAELYFVLLAI